MKRANAFPCISLYVMSVICSPAVGQRVATIMDGAFTGAAGTLYQEARLSIFVGRSGSSSYFNTLTDKVHNHNGALSSPKLIARYDSFDQSPDTTPPSVQITSLASNSVVSGTITISATASDDTAVAGVQFMLDGASVGTEMNKTPYTVLLNTTIVADGLHILTAVARDLASNTAISAPVAVNVDNTNLRKNIILIVTDDQRWDTIQYLPYVNSLLGNESIKFSNAFISTPDCCPSRASILTGLYSHNSGVMQDAAPTGGATAFKDVSTLATWLSYAGYRTGLFGKYLNGYTLLGAYVPPGWTEWHVADDYYNYDAIENGVKIHYGSTPADYHAANFGAKAVQFIQSAPANQPFFLMYTPFDPHTSSHSRTNVIIPPQVLPQDAGTFSWFPPWRPPSYNESDMSDKPLFMQNIFLLTSSQQSTGDTVARSQLEALQAVDRAVRDFVNALNLTGRLNNTVIIFMTDNGLLWGEHRLIDNKQLPYEESIRTPMWVWMSGQAGRTEDRLVQNLDIAPTIAEIAGVTPTSTVDGVSLVPLLSNSSASWRSGVLIETLGSGPLGIFGPISGDWSGVRTSQFKYVEYATGERELYDLSADPYEMINSINDPNYASVIPGLQSLLVSLRNMPPDTTPPSVSLSAPASGAKVSGALTVSATASDNLFVVGVQFLLDGASLSSEITTYPYTIIWDTTRAADGQHTLTARARDSAGNTTVSAPVALTVNNASQFARPNSDILNQWVTTPMWSNIGEVQPNDATWIRTAKAAGNVAAEVGLSAVAAPSVTTGNILRVRACTDGTGNALTYELRQGSTVIASAKHTLPAWPTITTDILNLTSTQASQITDYTNLRLHLTATAVKARIYVYWAELEVAAQQIPPPPPIDSTPPTVSLTAPTAGSTVSGTITVSANASDNVGVAGVQFQIDGVNLGPEATISPYFITWDTTATADGTHTLTAVARDASANTTVSGPVSVQVSNSVSLQPTLLAFAFNENAGVTTADNSGNNNAGRLINYPAWSAGLYGEALSFNGANTFVDAGNSASLNPSNSITLTAWIKSNNPQGSKAQFIVGKAQTGPTSWVEQYLIRINGTTGKLRFVAQSTILNGNTALAAGAWYHVAAVYDGSKMSIYINGNLDATISKTGKMNDNGANVSVGAMTNSFSSFNGIIDNVRIYGQALTRAQIQFDMNTPIQ